MLFELPYYPSLWRSFFSSFPVPVVMLRPQHCCFPTWHNGQRGGRRRPAVATQWRRFSSVTPRPCFRFRPTQNPQTSGSMTTRRRKRRRWRTSNNLCKMYVRRYMEWGNGEWGRGGREERCQSFSRDLGMSGNSRLPLAACRHFMSSTLVSHVVVWSEYAHGLPPPAACALICGAEKEKRRTCGKHLAGETTCVLLRKYIYHKPGQVTRHA